MKIRFVQEKDIERILEIYSYYIENTTITFEYFTPSYDEFKKRVFKIKEKYPFLVFENENKVYGYTYASNYYERLAYSWDCELSIYIDNNFIGKGIGKKLYQTIIDIIDLQGYYNVYARISIPNEKSLNIHKNLGFKVDGITKNTGFKHNKWIDIINLSKQIKEYSYPKNFPISINNININDLEKILKKYIK